MVETELALVAAASESLTLMLAEYWAVAVLAAAEADLLAEEEMQGQAAAQTGQAVQQPEKGKRLNQEHVVQA